MTLLTIEAYPPVLACARRAHLESSVVHSAVPALPAKAFDGVDAIDENPSREDSLNGLGVVSRDPLATVTQE
jgi:hypothetical protein